MLVSVHNRHHLFLSSVGLSLELTFFVIRVLGGLSPDVGGAVVPLSLALPASVGSPVLLFFIGVLVWAFKGAMVRRRTSVAQVMALI